MKRSWKTKEKFGARWECREGTFEAASKNTACASLSEYLESRFHFRYFQQHDIPTSMCFWRPEANLQWQWLLSLSWFVLLLLFYPHPRQHHGFIALYNLGSCVEVAYAVPRCPIFSWTPNHHRSSLEICACCPLRRNIAQIHGNFCHTFVMAMSDSGDVRWWNAKIQLAYHQGFIKALLRLTVYIYTSASSSDAS